MPNLSELQQWLLDDIYRGTNKTSPFIEDKHHNRLGIYRNNAYLTLIDCLEAFFPVTLGSKKDGCWPLKSACFCKLSKMDSLVLRLDY